MIAYVLANQKSSNCDTEQWEFGNMLQRINDVSPFCRPQHLQDKWTFFHHYFIIQIAARRRARKSNGNTMRQAVIYITFSPPPMNIQLNEEDSAMSVSVWLSTGFMIQNQLRNSWPKAHRLLINVHRFLMNMNWFQLTSSTIWMHNCDWLPVITWLPSVLSLVSDQVIRIMSYARPTG